MSKINIFTIKKANIFSGASPPNPQTTMLLCEHLHIKQYRLIQSITYKLKPAAGADFFWTKNFYIIWKGKKKNTDCNQSHEFHFLKMTPHEGKINSRKNFLNSRKNQKLSKLPVGRVIHFWSYIWNNQNAVTQVSWRYTKLGHF